MNTSTIPRALQPGGILTAIGAVIVGLSIYLGSEVQTETTYSYAGSDSDTSMPNLAGGIVGAVIGFALLGAGALLTKRNFTWNRVGELINRPAPGRLTGIVSAPPIAVHNAVLAAAAPVSAGPDPALRVLEDRPGLIRFGFGTEPLFAVHAQIAPNASTTEVTITVAHTTPAAPPNAGVIAGQELDALLGRFRQQLPQRCPGLRWT